ncbi:MAG: helix-turn-helix transcriptional regulator [Deltaproteobacteria bacterium]|nr:helix-turn-helix transcriptional regulator [Deltaproteobacteria bacterium]
MFFKGQVWKDDKFWIIELPCLEISTQGKSLKDALSMMEDAVKCHVDKSGFKVKASLLKSKNVQKRDFSLSSSEETELVALFLKRQRQINHLTVREVAQRLGYASASAYAQYESGKHSPGLEKISRFIEVMNPKRHFTLEMLSL